MPRRPAWWIVNRERAGNSPTHQDQMVRPSSRKKNVQNRAITAPAATWPTVVAAPSAPDTMLSWLELMKPSSSFRYPLICSTPIPNGPASSQSMNSLKPSIALSLSSAMPLTIVLPATVTSPATTASNPRRAEIEASPREKRRCRWRKLRTGVSRTVRSSAIATGTTITLNNAVT